MHITLRFGSTSFLLIAALAGCHQATPPAQHQDVSPLVKQSQTQTNAPKSAESPSASAPLTGAEPDAPPAPGTALALAQRATTYAQSVEPAGGKRHAKPTAVASSDAPDADLGQFTPQAQIERSANAAVTAPAAPKVAPPPPTVPPDASASINVPTAQKLVAGGADADPRSASAATLGMDAVASRILSRAKDYSTDLSAQTDAQILKFVRDEPVPDVSLMAGLAPEDRELLGALMDSLTNFRNQLRADNNMLFSKKIRPLVELSDRLRSQAELSVPTVALCNKVNAYGNYEPIDPARFIAGKANQQAVVYCEVENFLSLPNEKNEYETKLTQDIVLYTEASGLPVWSDHKSTYDDKSRRRRHDFFMAKIITLPTNLTIGRYLLKVTVEDQQARHIAENTMPIEIVAQ
ncbi:MAG TPA: hypothetical protein VGI81_12440 [Tepidisphaeraceae bacterium]|jgi:hypothetical protein